MKRDEGIRVLHVYRTYFPDPPGGLQEAIKQICAATAALGIQTKVFTLSPNPIPQKIMWEGTEVTRSRSWFAPASCDLGGIDAVVQFRTLSKWADVIHYHFPWPFADILRLITARNKPAVMTYHSDIVRQRYLGKVYAPLMQRFLAGMSAVVATSPAYARTSSVLKQHVLPRNVRTIPLGIADYAPVDTLDLSGSEVLARLKIEDRPFLLALGVLRKYKGLHTLIEAANEIAGLILIAGSGPEEQALQFLARQMAVTNVIFAGQVSETEKIALLKQCRALVLPSHLRSEAFGMVLVEAAMFGKPMVCCEVDSGTSYVNLHGETGFVVPPESPVELAISCNRLLNNRPAAARMGEAARARYELLFSGAALGHAYADLYSEVLERENDIDQYPAQA